MPKSTQIESNVTIGIDVGDKKSHVIVLNADGDVIEETKISTTKRAFERRFKKEAPARIALEVGTHSPWMSRLLAELNHEVIVANARKLQLITKSDSKNDRTDAELLARLARVDPKLLSPIEHRTEQVQADRSVLKARHCLVRARVAIINAVRGVAKSMGKRLPGASSNAFARKIGPLIPVELQPALLPLVEQIGELTAKICGFDRVIKRLIKERYPVAQHLQQISGVGPISSLAFVVTIGDPHRFKKSRSVGAYLGLRPKQSESGKSSPELRITKAGDGFLRQTLVQSAQYILGHHGPDTDLRRWGLKLASRGCKRAKKVAVTAVARKLAVLLHRLWITGEVYQPLRASVLAAV